MERTEKWFCLDVRGEYACFTRPEMKAERVSYDVITPSSARAIFEAILWKPAIRWHIRRIEVLKPIKWTSVRRNEVSTVASDRSTGLLVEDVRTQRAALLLQDVAYRLHAWMEYVPPAKRKEVSNPVPERLRDQEELALERSQTDPALSDETPGKYLAMFERRARKGQCFNQPYLGCREFDCSFRLVDDPETEDPPIKESRDLGFMLYDLDFKDASDIRPLFYRPQMVDGVIEVPNWESDEVKR